MEDCLALENLFNDIPMYRKLRYKLFNLENDYYHLDNDVLGKLLKILGSLEHVIESLCNTCRKSYPFKFERVTFGEKYLFFSEYSYINFENLSFCGNNSIKKEKIFERYSCMLVYSFHCTSDNNVYHMFVRVSQLNGEVTISKIGQYPSVVDIQGIDFDKYKKILDNFGAYEDYKMSYFSYLDGFYAGSFTYLRRVFEKMILFYVGSISLKDNHIETKINACKDKISPDIFDLMKNLYEILSASIHELDEEQSKEYFDSLKAVIEVQLEYEKTNDEKEQTKKRLHGALSKISRGLKKS